VATTDGVGVHFDNQNGDFVNTKRNTAVIAVGAIVGALGIGGVAARTPTTGPRRTTG
jgi:hypothetical protein